MLVNNMRNKFGLYFFSAVIMSFIIFSILFLLIFNYQNEQDCRENLKIYNETVIKVLENNNITDLTTGINSSNVEIQSMVFNSRRKMIYKSQNFSGTAVDGNLYEKLIDDIINNSGYLIKHSTGDNKNYACFLSEFKNGDILISFKTVDSIKVFRNQYLAYYLTSIVLSLFLSFLLLNKLYAAAVKPLAYLEYITFRISTGETDIRAKVSKKEDTFKIAENINNIADKLQVTLRDSNEKQNRLEAILKSMDSGVIAVDTNKRIIMINPYAEKIFGVRNNIIGHNLLDTIRNYELEEALKNNKDVYKEIKVLWPKERVLRIKTADIINGNEIIGTVAVVQDISDIREFENMRSQFVANVSHELKTPLTSIIGFSETLKDVEDPVLRIKFLNIINDEAQRLTRLINDILSLSRIEQKKANKIEKVKVNKIVNDVYNLMKNIADNKKINLAVTGSEVPDLFGDTDEFKQMLINLVDNALKYSEEGAEVTIGTENKDNSLVLWVKDTGLGIPKKNIDRLFERFYRVDKARSRDKGGTGLGLAIVKHIVMNFNGTIEVDSKVGKGSKFTVKIPF